MGADFYPLVCCSSCGLPYPAQGAPYHCACGGVYDFSRFPKYVTPDLSTQTGLWRYRATLGLPDATPVITLGEGDTPLLQGHFGGIPVYYKMESQNPTGSFKDRGSTVLASFLLSRGVNAVVEDSSGNAGASLAAYCARAGIKAQVFIPESASGPKRWQIEMFGAQVERVPGPRANAAAAVLQATQRGKVYASHAYMPFGLTGIATIAYELFAVLGIAPGTVLAPVGHGGLLYGVMLGFEALQAAGIIPIQPYFIGVQAEACAPAVSAYEANSSEIPDIVAGSTLAEGASVARPMRADQILRRMLAGGGRMVSVSESSLKRAYVLAARQGIFVEPTACLPLAALLNDKIELVEPVVTILTGSGLKTNIISTNE